jgi:FSR family fosmidomycin resistance protein-like MFS transporter
MNFKMVTFMAISHIVNDSYMNFFQPLLPLIIPALGLSATAVGAMTALFSITSSLSQLIIGHFTDRMGTRSFIFWGPLLAAISMSSIGLVNDYALLTVVISLAGIGIAAFHPPASALVGSISAEKSGRAMSLFSLGGNIGFALMPLLVVPLAWKFGLSVTPVLATPGLVAAVLLYKHAPAIGPSHQLAAPSFIKVVRDRLAPFLCLLGTVAFRSLSFFSLVTFLPILLHQRGFSPVISGTILSVLAFSGALGGLIGGFISDSWGRKPVIISSLALAVPFLNLSLKSGDGMMVVWLGLSGASLLASFSVAVVAAQEIFPDNKATASSLALGFGLGLGGLGVGLIGLLVDAIGLERAISMISFMPLIAAAFALGLPGRRSEPETIRVVDYVDPNG